MAWTQFFRSLSKLIRTVIESWTWKRKHCLMPAKFSRINPYVAPIIQSGNDKLFINFLRSKQRCWSSGSETTESWTILAWRSKDHTLYLSWFTCLESRQWSWWWLLWSDDNYLLVTMLTWSTMQNTVISFNWNIDQKPPNVFVHTISSRIWPKLCRHAQLTLTIFAMNSNICTDEMLLHSDHCYQWGSLWQLWYHVYQYQVNTKCQVDKLDISSWNLISMFN